MIVENIGGFIYFSMPQLIHKWSIYRRTMLKEDLNNFDSRVLIGPHRHYAKREILPYLQWQLKGRLPTQANKQKQTKEWPTHLYKWPT
jgi:hypothetical protein